MALDHGVVAHRHADAKPGAAGHQDPRPDHCPGLDADVILQYRIVANRHALPDGGVLPDPHPGTDGGRTVNL